jgi:hypothetical protein
MTAPTTPLPEYRVRRAPPAPAPSCDWDGDAWARADTLEVACFRPEGSNHRPRTRARLLWSPGGLSGIFRVEDRWVRCVHAGPGAPVYRDSCVELFLEPRPGAGHLHFEWNAGGSLLAGHVRDPVRVPGGFRDFDVLGAGETAPVLCRHSLPERVDPEVEEPVVWLLAFFLPFAVLERRLGPLGPIAGQRWRGNFYKCGDDTSHPHWASWSPLDERNFHLPRCFGTLWFEE